MDDGHRVLKLGLWGLGAHAERRLLPAILECPRLVLKAVHTRKRSRFDAVVNGSNVSYYPDPEDLLRDTEIDAVYVATPTGLHYSMSERVLNAGKHVWCEKPLTESLSDAERLLDHAKSSDLAVLEATMFLFHPQFEAVQELLDSGRLGEVRSVTARFGFPHLDAANFRYDAQLGGGALSDAGFYPVAAAVSLLGTDLEVIGARMDTAVDFSVDTSGSALVRSGSRTALLEWGFGRAYRNEFSVWCEEGSVFVDRAFSKPSDLATTVLIRPQTGEEETLRVQRADQFALMLNRFVDLTLGESYLSDAGITERSRVIDAIRHASDARQLN